MSTPKTAPRSRRTSSRSKPTEPTTLTAKLGRATAALESQWATAEKALVRLRAGGADAFDALWETVHDVMHSDPPLYLGGGMRSEAEFIAKMLPGEDRRSVARNTLVALAFTPRDEAQKGIGFLEEVAKYVQELSGSKELPRAIDLDRLRIPTQRKDGDVLRKPARACSREEVVAARNKLGKKTRKPRSPAQKTLEAALAKKKTLAQVKVSARERTVTFSGVPLDALGEFAALLGRVRLE